MEEFETAKNSLDSLLIDEIVCKGKHYLNILTLRKKIVFKHK